MSINMFVYQECFRVFVCLCLSRLSAPGSVAYLLGFRPFWRSGKQTGGFPDAASGVVTLVFLPASHHRVFFFPRLAT